MLSSNVPNLTYGIFSNGKAECFYMVGTRRKLNNMPITYNINQLINLLNTTTVRDVIENTSYTPVRFLLKSSGELVFGEEGTPNGTVPAHYQMSAKHANEAECITAGNAFFLNNTLYAIDHKSGDFKPSFNSLRFAINKFIDSGMKVNDTIKIMHLDCYGKNIETHTIDFSKFHDVYNRIILNSSRLQYTEIMEKIMRILNESLSHDENNTFTMIFTREAIALLKKINSDPVHDKLEIFMGFCFHIEDKYKRAVNTINQTFDNTLNLIQKELSTNFDQRELLKKKYKEYTLSTLTLSNTNHSILHAVKKRDDLKHTLATDFNNTFNTI